MNGRHQVDLHGSISACDAAGRTLQVHCEGTQLTIAADSMRAVLSAFSALRASGAANSLDPRAMEKLNDFRIELRVGGQRVGRAGAGVRAGWLARALTRLPLELKFLALLKAGLTAF